MKFRSFGFLINVHKRALIRMPVSGNRGEGTLSPRSGLPISPLDLDLEDSCRRVGCYKFRIEISGILFTAGFNILL